MWTDQLLSVARAYATLQGDIDLRTVSSRVFDDGKILPRLADGVGTVTLARAEKALAWFSAHWPADTIWPEGVHRPDIANEEAGDAVA